MDKIENLLSSSKSYISFKIGDELFAIHVAYVNHIMEVPDITKVPNALKYISGIVNLRGTVLPVIDTRVRLNMSRTEFNALTCILVLDVRIGDNNIKLGALADDVHDVFELADEQILPPPDMKGLKTAQKVLHGIVKQRDKFIMLLNVNALFSDESIKNIDKHINNMKNEVVTN